MICSNCWGALSASDSAGVQTYTCANCEAIWIPQKTISILMKMEQSDVSLKDIHSKLQASDVSDRACPKCIDQKLKILTIKGIELDICQHCMGVFLDPGEIEKLLPKNYGSIKKEYNAKEHAVVEGVWGLLAILLS